MMLINQNIKKELITMPFTSELKASFQRHVIFAYAFSVKRCDHLSAKLNTTGVELKLNGRCKNQNNKIEFNTTKQIILFIENYADIHVYS